MLLDVFQEAYAAALLAELFCEHGCVGPVQHNELQKTLAASKQSWDEFTNFLQPFDFGVRHPVRYAWNARRTAFIV